MRAKPLALLLLLAVAAALSLGLSKSSYTTQDRNHIAEQASRLHWSGTDDLGRDRTVRLAGAFLLGLAGAVFASGVATFLSVSVGTVAAFSHRTIGDALMYVSDLMLTLPWLFLLMIVRSAVPLTIAPLQSAVLTFALLGLLSWPAYVRMTHAGARDIRNASWMIHGRAMGLRKRHLVSRYAWPRLRPLALAQFFLLVPVCLIAEANLGALGLGVSEPLPSYGSMLLALQHPAVLAGSHWSFAPIILLVFVLFLMELIVVEA